MTIKVIYSPGIKVFYAGVVFESLWYALLQVRWLAQLFELFRVGILIDFKVGFHYTQLLMLERRAYAFLFAFDNYCY